MNEQIFSLELFPSTKPLYDLKITGSITRRANQLAIGYMLFDQFKEVIIAPASDRPARKHELWKDTCFEFFLGIKDSEQYWEFNLTSAGHWNVYRFDGYRQGMQEETAFTMLPFSVHHQADGLVVALDIDLSKIVSTQVLEIAITSVIKHRNSEVTYWALTHRGAEADFHQRDSFIIEL
ncbi:DOMON-like domain-containing protein [aff. Roholtiella sp. LEGE 12411]|uniref:DOMON-like domain-containing protein n=1 Tax=aff. Roholtiella sp. LEGE 12411 TaxID=1828822 RepID=UPI00188295EB|nr:DOMON-like domain-containing protein [aff. Roholtiella sp. LEGE 12411]MBE9036543.1 DOMON-like domain-containing protein [aff. Roholtiella sp. LEGE 12411]